MRQTNRSKALLILHLVQVAISQRFIEAERMSNWKLQLQMSSTLYVAIFRSIWSFTSAYVYLQIVLRLPETHPDAHRKFMEGHHVVRGSGRFWAGLSTDIIIVQVLMRSIKTHVGLTRGKGMTEKQRLVWVLYMPVCTHQ